MTQVLPNREQIPKKGRYPHGLAWRMVYNHTDRSWIPRLDPLQPDTTAWQCHFGRLPPLESACTGSSMLLLTMSG